MSAISQRSAGTSALRLALASAILFAAVVLAALALRSFFRTESLIEEPLLTLLTDPAELAARQHDAIGTYATGDRPGDRVIIVAATGQISFRELGTSAGSGEITDTYRLARRDQKPRSATAPSTGGKLCLTTATSGVVDLLNLDTLVYCRDTYRRTK